MLTKLTPVLLAAALSFSFHAFAQCTKDADCKGDRICQQGTCVAPEGGTAATAPPPPSRGYEASPGPAVELGARRMAIKEHVLTTIGGLALGPLGANFTLLILPVEFEYALVPNFSLFGQLAPLVLSVPNGSYPGATLGAGARFYPFGTALSGLWFGGLLAATFGGGGAFAPFDLTLQGGWAWVFDSGFYLSVGGALSLGSLFVNQIPVGILVPIGFAF